MLLRFIADLLKEVLFEKRQRPSLSRHSRRLRRDKKRRRRRREELGKREKKKTNTKSERK